MEALLEIPPKVASAPPKGSHVSAPPVSGVSPVPARPVAIRELINEKKPKTHSQFITLFAYYREKYQNQPNFSRDTLEQYYSLSRENSPANYDRDFVNAVKEGWIHEDGENSYLTSKGIEAVESGFSERSSTASVTHKKAKKAKRASHRKKKSR